MSKYFILEFVSENSVKLHGPYETNYEVWDKENHIIKTRYDHITVVISERQLDLLKDLFIPK